MLYYRVKQSADNRQLGNRYLIGGELYTKSEIKKVCPREFIREHFFVPVEISCRKTHRSFGARFENDKPFVNEYDVTEIERMVKRKEIGDLSDVSVGTLQNMQLDLVGVSRNPRGCYRVFNGVILESKVTQFRYAILGNQETINLFVD